MTKKIVISITILCVAGVAYYYKVNEVGSITQSSFEKDSEEIELEKDVFNLQSLVEEALVWRVKATEIYMRAAQSRTKEKPMSATDIQSLHDRINEYLLQRKQILELAYKYAWLASESREIVFREGRGSRNLTDKSVEDIIIDPSDRLGQLTLKRMKLSLSAALTLYDNYLIALHPFMKKAKLRWLVEFDNGTQYRALKEVTLNYMNESQLHQVQRGVRLFDQEQEWQRSSGAQVVDKQIEYLNLLILGSYNYPLIRQHKWIESVLERVTHKSQLKTDSVLLLGYESMNTMSKAFGNSIGLVYTRQGKLFGMAEKERNQIVSELRPLDVLIERTPFRLTDKFIPGYFGHIAIWVGTPQDLKNLGIWDHELVKKHHKSLEAGRSIVEALRPGVQINSMKQFLNVDDFGVLRHKTLTIEQTRQHLLRAFKQIGKDYDFNFDVETDKRIVCSELAYVVFTDEKWPTERSLGRITISPSNVAVRATSGGSFELLELYHDGRKVRHDHRLQYFEVLLRDEPNEIAAWKQRQGER